MANIKGLTPLSVTLLIISVSFWGLAFPIIKITLDYVPPLVIGYFRYFIASLPFIFFILIFHNKNEIKKELVQNWKILIGLGITMVTIPNITQNIGLLFTTSSIAALIGTVAPVFTVIIAIIFLKESKELRKIIGLIIAISSSILLVVYTGLEITEATLYGNLLMFITSVTYGVSGIFSKIALNRLKPVYVTGFGMLFGSIILMPISILFQEPVDWAFTLSMNGWWLLLILTLFPCLIATFLWYVVLETYEVSKQVLFTYLIPVFAAIFAFLLIGEILNIITIFLGVLIIIGITIAEGGLMKNKEKFELPDQI